jgi:addiction module HigA family antidote
MQAPPIHPGEVLADELDEAGLSAAAFARQIGVPPNRVSQILAGKRAISGDTALRLAHWFEMSPRFWMNLQTRYDLALAQAAAGADIARLPRRRPGPASDAA